MGVGVSRVNKEATLPSHHGYFLSSQYPTQGVAAHVEGRNDITFQLTVKIVKSSFLYSSLYGCAQIEKSSCHICNSWWGRECVFKKHASKRLQNMYAQEFQRKSPGINSSLIILCILPPSAFVNVLSHSRSSFNSVNILLMVDLYFSGKPSH